MNVIVDKIEMGATGFRVVGRCQDQGAKWGDMDVTYSISAFSSASPLRSIATWVDDGSIPETMAGLWLAGNAGFSLHLLGQSFDQVREWYVSISKMMLAKEGR